MYIFKCKCGSGHDLSLRGAAFWMTVLALAIHCPSVALGQWRKLLLLRFFSLPLAETSACILMKYGVWNRCGERTKKEN